MALRLQNVKQLKFQIRPVFFLLLRVKLPYMHAFRTYIFAKAYTNAAARFVCDS